MIFAACDFMHFKRESGRYSRASGTDLMCGAYVSVLPEEVLLLLQEGDQILVGNFGSWISWLIMYLTNSQISHVAAYVGDGKILHATLSGGEVAPIATLFGPRVRLLACKTPIPPERRSLLGWQQIDDAFLQRPYSVPLVCGKRY